MTKRIFAVVHVLSLNQAVLNCGIAKEAGCDGVFLIAHETMDWSRLLSCVEPCRAEIPYVGVNFLDLLPSDAVAVAAKHKLHALWTDGTFRGDKPPVVEVFSGFAFKYQKQPSDLFGDAQDAALHCDVLTTSGPGTARPANVEKVATLRKALDAGKGAKRLALASGVSIDNVDSYLPYVDDYLVASSIGRSWHKLDLEKAQELATRIHR